MDLSAKTLQLVDAYVFLPAEVQQKSPETDFPSHPCLKVVATLFAKLSPTWGRRLVTYEKVENFDIFKHLENARARTERRKFDEQDANYLDLSEEIEKNHFFAGEESNARKKIQRDVIRRRVKNIWKA